MSKIIKGYKVLYKGDIVPDNAELVKVIQVEKEVIEEYDPSVPFGNGGVYELVNEYHYVLYNEAMQPIREPSEL